MITRWLIRLFKYHKYYFKCAGCGKKNKVYVERNYYKSFLDLPLYARCHCGKTTRFTKASDEAGELVEF